MKRPLPPSGPPGIVHRLEGDPSGDQHLEMEPRAADFLELLRDLGHLDDAAVERITGELVARGREGGVVTLAEIRRVVAVHLFEKESAVRPEVRELLVQEWPRLLH